MKTFVIATLAALTPTAALATGTVDDHVVLRNTLENIGVRVVLNSPTMCDDETAGAYASYQRVVFVCQENAKVMYHDGGWTDYDLDTLRHEAHHVIQDCLDGGIGDNTFANLFDDEQDFEEFVRSALTDDQIDWVVKTYSSEGSDVILNELEAFAAAAAVKPSTIAEALSNSCKFQF